MIPLNNFESLHFSRVHWRNAIGVEVVKFELNANFMDVVFYVALSTPRTDQYWIERPYLCLVYIWKYSDTAIQIPLAQEV